MAWKKWLEGLVWSGVVSAAALGTGWFADGVTGAEWKMLGVTFLGGILLYIKTHDAPVWDGTDRRQDAQEKK